MKKVVRLTESDLVRLVKKVIKENEFEDDEFEMDMSMGPDCDEIIDAMDDIFQDFKKYFKHSSPDTKSILGASAMYNDLESELGGLLDIAEENDCENRYDIESKYEELLNRFVKVTEMDNDMDNMTESIRQKTRKFPRR
jgi:hypothetical protein